ncbi:hypothetical protein BH10PAT3_BH10PAT3_1730 [soil metagenome]
MRKPCAQPVYLVPQLGGITDHFTRIAEYKSGAVVHKQGFYTPPSATQTPPEPSGSAQAKSLFYRYGLIFIPTFHRAYKYHYDFKLMNI